MDWTHEHANVPNDELICGIPCGLLKGILDMVHTESNAEPIVFPTFRESLSCEFELQGWVW